MFVSPDVLVPTNAALDEAGIAIEGIDTDIYGQPRSSPPDIGAIEFDTTSVINTPLAAGTYTIGGNNGDYATFNEAVVALEGGVSGPVTFKVQPGTYQEQVNISSYPGQSAQITFESQSTDSSQVVLRNSDGAALLITGVENIVFRGMTIYGTQVRDVGELYFENNVLVEGVTAVARGIDEANGKQVYRRNVFKNQGLLVDRSPYSDPVTGTNFRDGPVEVAGNTFEVQGDGISLAGQRDITIKNNTMTATQAESLSGATGIKVVINYLPLSGRESKLDITNNVVTVNGMEATGIQIGEGSAEVPDNLSNNKITLPEGGTGIEFGNVVNQSNKRSLVVNNVIAVKGNQGSIGIDINSFGYGLAMSFYFNSVYLYGEDATSKALSAEFAEVLNAVLFYDNIFANLADGYVIYVDNYEGFSLTVDSSDYNNLYTTGEVFAQWGRFETKAATFTKWQEMAKTDANSLSVNPQFVSPENLTPGNEALAGAGVAIPEVDEDFFGNERPDPPTIGAVELEGEGGNQIPTADAGPDRTVTLPQESIILRGVAFDTDGVFRAFQWEKVSDPSVTLERANTANVIVKDLVVGEYVFRFSATDNDGATASDELTLTVKGGAAANEPPTADAGPDKTLTLPKNAIILRGTGNDPDGNFRAFRWEKVSGPSATLNQANTANLKLSNLVAGEYVFRFSATDNDGATASDETTLRVVGASEAAPLASNTRVTAYPNTFRDDVNVKIESAQPESYQMQVYDALGRIYYQNQITAEPLSANVQNIDLSNQGMQEGVYFISIHSAYYRKVIRVVKAY